MHEREGYQPLFFQFFTLGEDQAIQMERNAETPTIDVFKYALGEDGIPDVIDYMELTKEALERYKKWFLELPKPDGNEAAAKMFEVARFLLKADLLFDGVPFTP